MAVLSHVCGSREWQSANAELNLQLPVSEHFPQSMVCALCHRIPFARWLKHLLRCPLGSSYQLGAAISVAISRVLLAHGAIEPGLAVTRTRRLWPSTTGLNKPYAAVLFANAASCRFALYSAPILRR